MLTLENGHKARQRVNDFEDRSLELREQYRLENIPMRDLDCMMYDRNHKFVFKDFTRCDGEDFTSRYLDAIDERRKTQNDPMYADLADRCGGRAFLVVFTKDLQLFAVRSIIKDSVRETLKQPTYEEFFTFLHWARYTRGQYFDWVRSL